MYIQSEHYVYKGYLNQTVIAAFYLYKQKSYQKATVLIIILKNNQDTLLEFMDIKRAPSSAKHIFLLRNNYKRSKKCESSYRY